MITTIDEFIKDANSILNTLDKDYTTMQSQKAGIRQDQIEKFSDLCENMGRILEQYSKTIWDFKNKSDVFDFKNKSDVFDFKNKSDVFDSERDRVLVYKYPEGDNELYMCSTIWWTSRDGKPTYDLTVYVESTERHVPYKIENLAISEVRIERQSIGFRSDIGYSDIISTFLNHCPSYEQLDTLFQTALTRYIKTCVTYIQKRNENIAAKIKSITE